MATINSTFKMQDQATSTLDRISGSFDNISNKAQKLNASSDNVGKGIATLPTALDKANRSYDILCGRQDKVNAKLDAMRAKEKDLTNTKVNGGWMKTLATTIKVNAQLIRLRNAKERLVGKSDDFTKKILEQEKEMNRLKGITEKIEPPDMDGPGKSISTWGEKLVVFNQGLELAKKLGTALKAGLDYSDNLSLNKARLNLINDGLQTTEGLQDKIFAAAERSRGSYDTMTKSVAKLGLLAGDAFKSNDEMVAFSEMLNKSFKVSGSSNQEIESATYQLTQAMAAGKLQGDEFRSVSENAPMLADAIAKYMGKSKGELKELSSEGVITADIIKNALFTASDDINAKFDQMPKTFADATQSIENNAQRTLQPVADKISNMLNSDSFQAAVQSCINVVAVLGNVLYWLLGVGETVFQWMQQNSGIVQGIMTGLAIVLTGLLVPAIWSTIKALFVKIGAWMLLHWQLLAVAAIVGLVVAALQSGNPIIMFAAFAVLAVAAAWWFFNGALYACPLVWIIVLIVLVIAAIFMLITWILKLVGSTNSALGIICGAIMVAVAFVWNLFLGLLDLVLSVVNQMINPWIAFANFFANLFNDPIGAIIHLFGDFADSILGVIESIAKALDKVFGSNLAGSVKKWRSGLSDMVEKAANKHGNGSYEKVADNLNLSSESLGLKRFEYGDAWNKGLDFGNNLSDSIGNFSIGDALGGLFDQGDGFMDQGFDMSSMIDPNGNMPVDVKKNSDKEVEISDEDLKLLKDIATRDYMLNYKQITPNVNISFGDVRETADINQIKDSLQRMMEEELSELYVVEEA